MTKVSIIHQYQHVQNIMLSGNEIFQLANITASNKAHELAKEISEADAEEILEHMWMVVAAIINARAEKYGNTEILEDWKGWIRGPKGWNEGQER